MFRPDIAFSRDDANRFLPWMVALMAAMTALMLLLGLTLKQWVGAHESGQSNTLTVQLPPDEKRSPREVVNLLEGVSGIQSIRSLSPEEVRALVSPWVGEGEALEGLTLPAVIDVTLAGPDSVDVKALSQKIKTFAPGASVDTQALWVEKFSNLSRAMQAAMLALGGCILSALAGMMVFAARASMKLHHTTVMLLHGIGAEDAYIARQFQRNAFALALKGALPGAALAGGLYAALGAYMARLDAPMLPSLDFGAAHVAGIVLLPLMCGVIAVVSVRMATLKELRRLP